MTKILEPGSFFGEIDPALRIHLENIQKNYVAHDDLFIMTDYDSYCEAQQEVDRIFLDQNELCKRSLTALAKCGDLSCDKSIVTYCQ